MTTITVAETFMRAIDGDPLPDQIVYLQAPPGMNALVGGITIQSDGLTYRIRSDHTGLWDALVSGDTELGCAS